MLAAVELASLLFLAWFDLSVESFLFRAAISPLNLLALFWYMVSIDISEFLSSIAPSDS